ncbi:hypothetical protein H5410_045412 [Solanum commersonii]|uniref:Uncharacterized protein n=1 Tax=Solanum commersonii TaxID=4109 RepID=A0A9J5XB24_SOLCO|nr:hypothetical protein H5410_045412 [Solanum commersonii]
MDFSGREVSYPCLDMVEDNCCMLLINHLRKWSSTETKDVMDNFSGKVTTEKVLLLKSSTHQNVVVSFPLHCDENLSSWRVPPSGFGEVLYTFGDFGKHQDYDAIFVLMFIYDHNENVLQAFCKNFHPSTNTVSTFVKELFISLWDLRTIGGLPVHGSFYDEFIPSAKELTHHSTKLPKVSPMKSPFENGHSSDLEDRENMLSLHQGQEEITPLVKLGVEESLKDDTYLVAFLTMRTLASECCLFSMISRQWYDTSRSLRFIVTGGNQDCTMLFEGELLL